MTNRRGFAQRRRGLVAVAVLITLIVLGLLLGVLLRTALIRRVSQAKVERRLQAEALARSALERAGARLATSPEYPGETWDLSAEDLGRRDGAVVSIKVERVEGKPDRRRVVVQADYPRPAERRARSSKTVFIDLKRAKSPESGAKP